LETEMATATDVTAFIAAAGSFRDAWVNYNPNDNNSRNALIGAATGLGAATVTLANGSQVLNLIGVTSAGISLSADVGAYNEAVIAHDSRAQTSATFAIVSDVAGGAAGMAAVLAGQTSYKPASAALGLAATGLTLVNASAVAAKFVYDATNRLDDFLGNWGNDINKNMLEEMQLFGGGPITQYASTALNGAITAANAAEAGNTVKLSAGDSPEGAKLVVGLDPNSSGGARQIVFDPQAGTATIQAGNGSGVTVAAGSQISVGSDNVRASTFDDSGALEKQQDVFTNGTTAIKYLDTRNTHPYKELDVSENSNGQITAAQAQLDQNIIAAGGSVGQIFGSAIGRALAPDDPFKAILASTVAGLIGQKLLQTFTASLTLDASRFVAGDFASVSGLDVAHAGIGAISSFLTAELGHELHLTGLAGDIFNSGAGGVTASVLNQVIDKIGTGVSFDAAIGAISWGTAATQAGYNVTNAVGAYLAHAFVPAQSHEGAVGGQLLGAVGSALGVSAALNAALTGVLGFLIPGLGSFFGTIVGTMLGDAIHGDPAYPKATHDIEIIGSDPTHFQNRLVGTDDHGNAAISQQMGDQVAAIANSYLDAVHGAAIAYSGKVMIGYNSGAAPYQYITGWFPNGTEVTPHFANATDAIQEGVRELLVNTEVIGGDLLIKRAHQAFINGPHPVPNETSPDFSDLISLGGNLSVAQDYENYLNNREAINALIAANPNRGRARGTQPRAGSRVRLQRRGIPRPFGAAARGESCGRYVVRHFAESEVPPVAMRTTGQEI
jgi:hypothetical protein